MGSSRRKRKEKQKDFQKVRLKVGKKKPKGLNVTDTTFKAKKITIREQLQTLAGEEAGDKTAKLVKDLLSNLSHHNSSTRIECLHKLKDSLTAHPSAVVDNLTELIDRVTPLMVDRESKCRASANSILALVLGSSRSLDAFQSAVMTHVNCALTHINQDVQIDSLLFLDTVYQKYPGFLSGCGQSATTVITNLLNLISRTGGKQTGSKEVLLLVNPSHKLTNQKWRLSVLKRIRFVLELVLKCDGSVDSGVEQQARLMDYGFVNTFGSDVSSTKTVGIMSSTESAMQFCSNIVPLLFEVWVESSVQEKTSHKNSKTSLLTNEAIEVLDCVIAILILLMNSVDKNNAQLEMWFSEQYRGLFLRHMFENLPYSPLHAHGPSSKHGSKQKDVDCRVVCRSVNGRICYLYGQFYRGKKSGHKGQDKLSSCISAQIDFFRNEKDTTYRAEFELVLTVSKSLIHELSNEACINLLNKIISCYSIKSNETWRGLILYFMGGLSQEHDLLFNRKIQSVIDKWNVGLIEQIADGGEVCLTQVEMCRRVSQKPSVRFALTLKENSKRLLAQISNLVLIGKQTGDLALAQRKLVELLFTADRSSVFTSEFCRQLVETCKNPQTDIGVVCYMLQLFTYKLLEGVRCSTEERLVEDEAVFICALLNTCVLDVAGDQTSLLIDDKVAVYMSFNVLIDAELDESSYNKYGRIVETVGNCLTQFSNSKHVRQLLQCFVRKLIENRQSISLQTIVNLITLHAHLYDPRLVDGEKVDLAGQSLDLHFAALFAMCSLENKFWKEDLRQNVLKSILVTGCGRLIMDKLIRVLTDDVVDLAATECLVCCAMELLVSHQGAEANEFPKDKLEITYHYLLEKFGKEIQYKEWLLKLKYLTNNLT